MGGRRARAPLSWAWLFFVLDFIRLLILLHVPKGGGGWASFSRVYAGLFCEPDLCSMTRGRGPI